MQLQCFSGPNEMKLVIFNIAAFTMSSIFPSWLLFFLVRMGKTATGVNGSAIRHRNESDAHAKKVPKFSLLCSLLKKKVNYVQGDDDTNILEGGSKKWVVDCHFWESVFTPAQKRLKKKRGLVGEPYCIESSEGAEKAW